MSQLIACKSQHGILLAADSKAFDVDAYGTIMEYNVSRLLQLTDNSVLLSGGAAAGAAMARAFKGFVSGESLDDVDAIYEAALPFLASEYTEFMRKSCEVQPLDPMHHVHFILAGRSRSDQRNPYKMYFLWTKKKLPQLAGEEISDAFAVPRIIRLEYQLSRLAADGGDLDSLQKLIREGFQSRMDNDDEVGGPVVFSAITADGLSISRN